MKNVGSVVQIFAGGQLQRITPVGISVDDPQISPDGKWLAYVAADGGVPRVYVQPFPSLQGRWAVSPDGGVAPRWRSDSEGLYFTSRGTMFQVNVGASETFHMSAPEPLFSGEYQPAYDVLAAGDRFLMLHHVGNTRIGHLNVILNWLP